MGNWKPEDDWFHEFNVQSNIKKHLESKLGSPIKEANCLNWEKGPDLLYSINKKNLRIEVKGYPSDKYVKGPNKGKKKKTPANTQAKHWFGQVLQTLILAKGKDPNLELAIGLPKFNVYLTLWEKSSWATKKLDISCYWVSKKGEVSKSK